MTGVFEELVRLQDDYSAKSREARGKPATSPEAVALEAALVAYNTFKDRAARDFRILLACAAENRLALDELTMRVAVELSDKLDFDAFASQAHHAGTKLMDLRHKLEALERDFEELRKQWLSSQNPISSGK